MKMLFVSSSIFFSSPLSVIATYITFVSYKPDDTLLQLLLCVISYHLRNLREQSKYVFPGLVALTLLFVYLSSATSLCPRQCITFLYAVAATRLLLYIVS